MRLLPLAALLALLLAVPVHTGNGDPGRAPPPPAGDWSVANVTTVGNTTIYLDGNLTIEAGGSLTLVNSSIVVNASWPVRIAVKPGALLRLMQSRFEAASRSPPYQFVVEGRVEADGSAFRGAGSQAGSPHLGGVQLVGGEGWFTATVFEDNNGTALSLVSSTAFVAGCSFNRNGWDGIYGSGSTLTVENTTIRGSAFAGISLDESNATLSGTIVSGSGSDGLRARGGRVDAKGTTFVGNEGWGVQFRNRVAGEVAARYEQNVRGRFRESVDVRVHVADRTGAARRDATAELSAPAAASLSDRTNSSGWAVLAWVPVREEDSNGTLREYGPYLLGVSLSGAGGLLTRSRTIVPANDTVVNITLDLPDLVLAPVAAPRRITAGETLRLSADVENRGHADARNVSVRLSAGGKTLGEAAIPLLAPGERATVRITGNTAEMGGTTTFSVRVDPRDAVPEADEGNNSRDVKTDIAPTLAEWMRMPLLLAGIVAVYGLWRWRTWRLLRNLETKRRR